MTNLATSEGPESASSILETLGYVKRRFNFGGGQYAHMHIFDAGGGWHVSCSDAGASGRLDLRFGAYTDDFVKVMRLGTLNSLEITSPDVMYILPIHFIPPERDFREGLAQTKEPPKTWLAHHITTAVHPFLLGDKTYDYSLKLLESSFLHLPLTPWSRVVLLRLTGRKTQLTDFAANWRERVSSGAMPTDAFDGFIARVRAWSS